MWVRTSIWWWALVATALFATCAGPLAAQMFVVDVDVIKTGPTITAAGQNVTFTLNMRNGGTFLLDASANIVVTDTLPAVFAGPVSASGTGWNCTVAGLAVSCQFVGTMNISFVNGGQPFPAITVTAKAVAVGGYSNCARVKMVGDTKPNNDSSCLPGTVTPGATAATEICVFKYQDQNGNGLRDLYEGPLSGIPFSVGSPGGYMKTTDNTGRACFPLLPPVSGGSTSSTVSIYDFYETVPAGWVNTDPGGAIPHKTVTVPAGQVPPMVAFGNRRAPGLDVGIETLMRPTGGGGLVLEALLGAGGASIPAGRQLVIDGSLSPVATFSSLVAPPGWACSGNWNAFQCSTTTAAAAMSAPLRLKTAYPPSQAGSPAVFTASARITANVDPNPVNNSRTLNVTLP